jgi:pantoate--beta-alanine ligase
METLRTIADLRRLRAGVPTGRRVGLVPTMGALHEGHRSLLDAARAECDLVVMSLFVNPAQFAAGEDLGAYPRNEAADLELAQAAGVDVVFAPAVAEIYPDGFSTSVVVRGVSEPLEGAARGAGHFEGVATVVTKLLNIVTPDVAYFGQKDAQQALVIRRLVADLDIPVRIAVCPTVREPDGLARSSRNAYLTAGERERASALPVALGRAAELIAGGERDGATATAAAREELAARDVEPEYLEIVDPDTLAGVTTIAGPVLVAVAARIGRARLIDNLIAAPTPTQER